MSTHVAFHIIALTSFLVNQRQFIPVLAIITVSQLAPQEQEYNNIVDIPVLGSYHLDLKYI